ncbi:MAG: hypothetical protein ACJ76H_07120 [Bacteriovoracaceae bacterium]
MHASEIIDEFKKRDYDGVHRLYQENPSKNYSKKELVLISYSLRKLGFYRQDVKLNVRLVKKEYDRYHKRLIKQIKAGDTIDADQYPEGLKVLYWNLMNAYGEIILGYETNSQLIKKDHEHYLMFAKILSELEFREGKVDKLNDKIMAHILKIQNAVYKYVSSWYLTYMSWQQESQLHGPGQSTNLIVTNKGFCLGGDVGYENANYHWYVDGCAFYGSGGVSSDSSGSDIHYQQSNVPAYGLKFGPGASLIVSSTKSRIGFKIPVVYNVQRLTNPTQPGYSISSESAISVATTLYSRWQFNKWYFTTEFGKYVDREATIWSLGFGRNF